MAEVSLPPTPPPFPKEEASGQSTAGWRSGSSIIGLCKGDHTNHIILDFFFLFLRTLLCDSLLCQNLLLRFSLTVGFLLMLCLFLNTGKILLLVQSTGRRKFCKHYYLFPRTDPLLNQLSAYDLAGPGGMMQAYRTSAQIHD